MDTSAKSINSMTRTTKQMVNNISSKLNSANKVYGTLSSVRNFGQKDTMSKIGTIAEILKMIYSK